MEENNSEKKCVLTTAPQYPFLHHPMHPMNPLYQVQPIHYRQYAPISGNSLAYPYYNPYLYNGPNYYNPIYYGNCNCCECSVCKK